MQNQDAEPEFRYKEKDAGEDYLGIGPYWFEVPRRNLEFHTVRSASAHVIHNWNDTGKS
jgi:hypothetical protein